MTKVYRMETVEGKGMYSARNSNCDYVGIGRQVFGEDDNMAHPIPQDDSLLMINLDWAGKYMSDMLFAFCSIDQLRRWIYRDEWLRDLHKFGIFLAEYECYEEDVIKGYTQALFGAYENKKQFNILEYFGLEE